MQAFQELLAKRQALDSEIAAGMKQHKAEGMEQVQKLMDQYEIKVSDLGKSAKGPKPGKKAAIKFKDEKGNQWSGRGLQPRWIKAALAAGAKLEDYRV